jgi:hypothetical protein
MKRAQKKQLNYSAENYETFHFHKQLGRGRMRTSGRWREIGRGKRTLVINSYLWEK